MKKGSKVTKKGTRVSKGMAVKDTSSSFKEGKVIAAIDEDMGEIGVNINHIHSVKDSFENDNPEEGNDVDVPGLLDPRRLLATVNGMKIYSDTMYLVVGKVDESAPTGMVEEGIAKYPFPGNKTVCRCPYDTNSNVYDTGFYKNSKSLSDMPLDDRVNEVEMRVENILRPYESVIDKTIVQSDLDFWDNKSVSIYNGRVFSTDNPQDLFDLYIAVHSFGLTPQELDGDPRFMDSLYCVEDKSFSVDVKSLRAQYKIDAISKFNTDLMGVASRREAVLDLLLYLGVITRTDIKERSLYKYQFMDWIDRSFSNAESFILSYRKFFSGNNSLILRNHRVVKVLMEAGDVQITPEGVFFNGRLLGRDMKDAAFRMYSDEELRATSSEMNALYNARLHKEKDILEG